MAVSFEMVLSGLREAFANDRVNVEEVKNILGAYKSNRSDWQKFYFVDPHRYTRNIVDRGNGHYNVMMLVWGPGMGSSIHDHADAHCFVKMLAGNLKETQYHWPKEGEEKMIEKSTDVYDTNGVTYINDSIGLHRMENASHTDVAVSLHVYIPAFEKCAVFDERTAKKTEVRFTFYSELGERTNTADTLSRKERKALKQKSAENVPSTDSMDGSDKSVKSRTINQ